MTGKYLGCQLMVVCNVNTLLRTHVTELEKQQAKIEQCSSSAVLRVFFAWASSVFSVVSLWDATIVGTKVKILKICLSGLVEISFFFFLSLPCTFLANHLCCLLCYQVSCFCACLNYIQYSPHSQGTEFQSFLVRLRHRGMIEKEIQLFFLFGISIYLS